MVAFQFAKDRLRDMEDDHLAKQMWEDFLKQGARCNMVQKLFADQGGVARLSGKLWRGYADKENFIMERRADENAEPPDPALKRRIVDLDARAHSIELCDGKRIRCTHPD